MSNDSRPLIAHVLHHLVVGGMENGLVNLVNRLPRDEFRHLICCIEDYSSFSDRIERDDVDVFALHRSEVGARGVRRALYRVFRERRPKIVHSRGLSGLDALPSALLAGVPRRVHGEHGWDVDNIDGANRRPLWLRRLHSPMVDRYVTVSRDLRRYLIDRVGISERRVSTICNGVDTEHFRPGPQSTDLGLPASFVGEHVVRIGTIARLQPVKDQATLISAAAAALKRRPEVRSRMRVIVVGDGPMRASLVEQALGLDVADLVWFPGATDRVADWMRALDVFVLPSLNEGISNTLLEAMATGIPTLVTPVGGSVELLEEGVSGASFPTGDVDALAQSLLMYIDDVDLRRRQGAGARARAVREFSLTAMVDGYRDLYRRLVEQ